MTVMQEKEGVERQNSNKGFEKNEPARIVERFSVFLDSTACPYLKLAGPSSSRPTRKNQLAKARLSSDCSERESRNRSWGSLAWVTSR